MVLVLYLVNLVSVHVHVLYNKHGLVLFNSRMEKEVALGRAHTNTSSVGFKVMETAYILHSSLVRLMNSISKLPASLSLNYIKAGQTQPPDLLLRFFES